LNQHKSIQQQKGTNDLGWDLDSSTETLGETEITLLTTSLDGVVEVVAVGSRRHVELVLLGEEPGMGESCTNWDLSRVATYFFKVGRETPARASSGWALTHSWLISEREQHKSGLERETSSEKGHCEGGDRRLWDRDRGGCGEQDVRRSFHPCPRWTG